MHTFFKPNIEKNNVLSEQESKHAVKVLRLRNGDVVRLVDGAGHEAEAVIIDAHHKRCEVEVVSVRSESESERSVAIAIAPTKSNDRIEWFIEKAVEIGVTEIIPLICVNSERKKININRWEKVILSALKQSGRLWLPKLHDAVKFSDFIKKSREGGKAIAYCGSEYPKKEFKTIVQKKQILLIGPEGDFASEEVDKAVQRGYVAVTLGENRLRTETAGVVACTIMKFSG